MARWQVLLEWKADPDIQDLEGNTALHHTEAPLQSACATLDVRLFWHCSHRKVSFVIQELINMGPILSVLVREGKASTDIVNKRGLRAQLPMNKNCPVQ